MANADALQRLALSNPMLLAALAGGATGAGVGAMSSDEGEELRGALGGGLLGTGAGLVAGGASNKIRKVIEALTPTPQKAVITGGILGGGLGGYYGRSMLPEWVKKRLMTESELRGQAASDAARDDITGKEAQDMTTAEQATETLNKQAELEKTAAEQVAAFDYGVDVFCHDKGISKEALAAAYGVQDVRELSPRMIACINEMELEAAPQA